MVRHYKKKTTRRSWTDDQMQLALIKVADGKSVKSTAIEFGVPRATLQLKFKQSQQPHNDHSCNTNNIKKGN